MTQRANIALFALENGNVASLQKSNEFGSYTF